MAETSAKQPAEELGSQEKPSESVLGEAEPWADWETQLCLWSVGVGIVALVVLGVLVNQFLLP